MIRRLAECISACPYLEDREVKVNYLDKDIGAASIERAQSRKSEKAYTDGGRLENTVFVLALREAFGMGDFENQRIEEKCEAIEKWLEEEFLESKDDLGLIFLRLIKPFGISGTEGSFARYEAEIEVVYLKNQKF